MQHYIFNAIPTSESGNLCQDLVKSCAEKANLVVLRNKSAEGIGKALYRFFGMGALKDVAETDTIYIVMHGSGYGGTTKMAITRDKKTEVNGKVVWVPGVQKVYGVNELARALKKEELRTGFVDLHLLTCGSGFAGDENTHPSFKGKVVPNAVGAPLAKRLKDALAGLGYKSLKVTGYKGDILVNIKREGWFSVETPNGDIVAANLTAIQF